MKSKLIRYGFLSLILTVAAGCGSAGGGAGGNGSGGGGTGGGGGGASSPQIQRVEPSRTMIGVPQGGITLAGKNFTQNSTVLFDGVAVSTQFQQSDSLDFQIPIATSTVAQVHTVQVSGPGGNSNIATYEVYAPQPGPAGFLGQSTQYMGEALFDNSLVPDLNGDGRADLVLVVPASGSAGPQLVIRYGQPDGTFSAGNSARSFALPVTPNVVLAGDFNGDGHTDLLLLSENSSAAGSYQVLLNDGTAHFSSAGSGALPAGIFTPTAVGDFNHDGKLDFIYAASNGAQPFSLFYGNGDGSFTAPVLLGLQGAIVPFVSAADLNGDGYTDLVYIDSFPGGGDQVRVLLSSSNGSFIDAALPGLPSPVYALVVRDFNNDHIPDIFAVDLAGMGQVYLGGGDGTFTAVGTPIAATDNSATPGALSRPPVASGDFDGDGNVDIVTRVASAGPDKIVFLWGDGRGNFVRQEVISDHSFFLQAGDVNGDGLPDIFSSAGSDAGFAYPSVILGRTDRNFPSAQILLPPNYGQLSAGNVFGDGLADILVSGAGPAGGAGTPGTIYHWQPNGTFLPQGSAPACATVLVDLNGDGLADMVGISGTTLLIWKGDGTGQFQTPINEIPNMNESTLDLISFRDMDRDGFLDIVMPGVILYGKGNFQFDAVTIPVFQDFVVGDFDGDGIPDIATPSGVMFGQANRTFTAPMGSVPLPTSSGPFPTIQVADINRDGMDDLVLTSSSGPYVELYTSVGRQGFVLDQALIVNGYGATITSLTIGDFNGDGLPDLAAGMLGGDDVALFTNDGAGKYQLSSYAIGVNSVLSIAADFNGDGKPDLAFLNYNFLFEPPTVTVLLHK